MKKIEWNKNNFTSQEIFKKELNKFFSPSNFIGLSHQLDNDNFLIPAHLSEKYILTKTDKYQLLKNCCLHKNAKLAVDKENVKRNTIICPIHYWSYNMKGDLINAPFSNVDCKSTQLSIKSKQDVFEVKNILVTNENLYNELNKSDFLKDFDLSKYSLLKTDFQAMKGNWKEYGVVFNDSNHVKFFHTDMNQILDSESIEWERSKNYTAHRMKFKPNWMLNDDNTFTKYYKLLQQKGFDIKNDGVNNYAVTWFNLFPNVFIDMWAGFITFTFIEPINIESYNLHNIYLCKHELLNENEIQYFHIKSLDVVDSEDNIIINKIHQGLNNYNESELYEEYVISPTEEGDVHYITWLAENGSDFYLKPFNLKEL
jgi:choline monooxygenase